MSLASLIHKKRLTSGKVATATPATFATPKPVEEPEQERKEPTVATVATVTVANQPKAPPMTRQEEQTIRAWLDRIGETDPVEIADVIDKCRADMRVREDCLKRWNERLF